MNLNQYLRDVLGMTGTKVMCREGGCGSCIINANYFDYSTQKYTDIAVNSCLFPLYSCDGLSFTTVEGVGSKSKGFNEIQKRLVDKNGSQCGWCTTGMVMNMYSLLLEDPKPSKDKIESSFDGNICRCTGYRPILDAMKSFAVDEKPIDIEELVKLKCLNQPKILSNNKKKIHIINDDLEWYTPKTLDELFKILTEYKGTKYRIVSGNTSVGVYKNDGPYNVYINVKEIAELHEITRGPNRLIVGSQVTLKQLIDLFNDFSSVSGFEYLTELSNHISKIANVGVRNVATWSGNLVLKHSHNEFPSDVFICFETVGALITLVGPDQSTPAVRVTPSQLLNTSLDGKIIYSITFSPLPKERTFIKTFKVMPRSQNSHAYVNAGFRFTLDPATYRVQQAPTIVFGGINSSFNHAVNTENFLIAKNLNNENHIQLAFQQLDNELKPDNDPVLSSSNYRKSLAISLFYKYLLFINDKSLNPKYSNGYYSLIDNRDLSSGIQSYPTDPSLYPVSKPMTKLNALLQSSGEAKYTYDMELPRNGLHGAFILSTQGNCKIDTIDTTNALKMPGVESIILAKDVPGKNSFIPAPLNPEILFCEGDVDYAGQPIGLVVAESYEQALDAARAVVVKYKDINPPILNILDGIKAGSFYPKPIDDFKYGDPDNAIKNSPYVIEGDCLLDTQFHFYMEAQNATCEPNEDGFDIYCSTQYMDYVQNAVAQALNLPTSNLVNVRVKQIGGAYGGKITRANLTATAAAVASKVLNKTVRVALDLNSNMEIIGKRYPWYSKYKVGFNKDGSLNGVIMNLYGDGGNSNNDSSMADGPLFIDNAYDCKNWLVVSNLVKTNLPANTFTRSPGTFPAIALMESLIEHVAKYLSLDPLKVREVNLYKKGTVTPYGQPLPDFNVDLLINQLKASSDYQNRLQTIQDFNKRSVWKKKGLSITPIKWGTGWNGGFFSCFISIYSSDGSISLSHGGIEIGQGIHTKAVQICAYELGVPIETIAIKHTDNLSAANSQGTGGSITSELVGRAVIGCCKILNDNLEPVRKMMPSKYTWQELIAKAFSIGVDLSAHYWSYPTTDTPFQYSVYGCACTEAIIDVLTGETQILRTDILYDGGQSLNGEIDIGQAEGAFVMGLGFWLTEKVRYNPDSGRCLTNGTWEYKPPTTKDIPIDFRIEFLKNNPSPYGILGSKCIGEPPLCLTPSVAYSVKRAIESARADIQKDDYFTLNSPATVESIQQLCLVDYKNFKLYN